VQISINTYIHPRVRLPPRNENPPRPSGGGDKDKREKDEDMQAKEAEQILTAQEQQHTDIRMRRTKGKKRGAVLFFAPSNPSPRGRYNKILPVGGEKKRGKFQSIHSSTPPDCVCHRGMRNHPVLRTPLRRRG
jgi:hypothetical protein